MRTAHGLSQGRADRSSGLPATPRRTAPETPLHTAAPQFPGVDFQPQHIDFNTRDAEENDLAIRSSLVYFKHRWSGEAAVISGSEAFRIRVGDRRGTRRAPAGGAAGIRCAYASRDLKRGRQ